MAGQSFPNAKEAMNYLKTEKVKQRRAIELREKLAEDRQLIDDRKKNDPRIPFLPGHDQAEWFAKLDINGIWERVFEFLTNPSDVISAYLSCEMFQKHLEEKRKLILLPQMFAVLRDTGRLRYAGFNFDGCIPLGLNKLKDGSREVLKQRLVSSAWKKAAEEVFLVPPALCQPSASMWGWMESPVKCCFRTVEDVDSALNKLRNRNSCASLLRTVMVDDLPCVENDKESFYSKLEQFLEVHGDSVRGFCFAQYQLRPTRIFNYAGLCNLVSRMPHLKALGIDADWQVSENFFLPPEMDSPSRRAFQEAGGTLSGWIVQQSFPTLPDLEQFTVLSFPGQSESFVGEVISRNPTLTAVRLGPWDPFGGNNIIPDSIWDALGKLRLETFEPLHLSIADIRVDDLLRLKEADWPVLKFLRLTYNSLSAESEVAASDILKVLDHFHDSLVEFSLERENVIIKDDSAGAGVVVHMPNLKKFICPEIM